VSPDWTWRGELLGALNALAATLPFVLTYGFIAFGALGPAAEQAGLTGSVLAVAGGGLLVALLNREVLPGVSPSASSCLILGAAVLQWSRDPGLAGATPAVLALTAASVVGAGALMLAFGLLRAGRLVRYVPHPVLAGFMNGVAVLILLSQVAPALDLPPERLAREGWHALADGHPAALGVAVATLALALAVTRLAPRWPAALLALVLAGGTVVLMQSFGLLGMLVPLGVLQAPVPSADTLAPLASTPGWALLQAQAGSVAATALLLALVGTLESVLNLAAQDTLLNRRSDPDRLLRGLGLANLLLGPLGALPVVNMRLRALATVAAGGRSWRSGLLSSVAVALVFAAGLPLLATCPRAVVAGVVMMLAWTLLDRWSIGLLSETGGDAVERRRALGVVVSVGAVTLFSGIGAGVALGVLLSFVLLVMALNRSLVRSRASAAAQPSRRLYAPAQERVLAVARPGIEWVELDGPLFFGNLERLQRELEPLFGADRREVVLDLRRVATLDASAAVALERWRLLARSRGVTLRLAGVTADNRHGRSLAAHGQLAAWQAEPGLLHADADLAIEAAEMAALARAGLPALAPPCALADSALFDGLDAAEAEALAARLPARTLTAGERLFAQGDPGDALYVITAGSVSVRDPATGQRFVTFSAGMCFGETAVLDPQQGRTADAVADSAAVVHPLTRGLLEALERESPQVAARLHRNLARHLSRRLREAAAAWRLAAG
jgi:MFS superfamily sulfate permease-like transporter